MRARSGWRTRPDARCPLAGWLVAEDFSGEGLCGLGLGLAEVVWLWLMMVMGVLCCVLCVVLRCVGYRFI